MPFLLLLLISVLAGLGAAFLTRRYPGGATAPAVVEVAREAGEHATGQAAQRAARAARLDPERATGLALTLALLVIFVGGVLLALLAVVVRSTDALAGIDSGVAEWGDRHTSAWTHDALTLVTQLGETWLVVVVAIVVAGVELARTRSRWVAPFLLAVILGDKLLTEAVKQLIDRARPEIEAVAATLGPSFPSGHTSTAAASWAAFALVAGRWWGRRSLPALAGTAVGIAVAVALSRVFLDVHWLTDVLGGLALGWAWFAACAIAFGGRLLSFGAPAQAAGRGAAEAASAEPPEAASRSRS
ncbi:MAG TPA: phosphatase PAP2 family protein [Solirubrobacterales bacterium]|jgi:undecaprenyl-diphosphatase|nr:phosphatase PAP2 family protein [Solirubrobacterales bacterium]